MKKTLTATVTDIPTDDFLAAAFPSEPLAKEAIQEVEEREFTEMFGQPPTDAQRLIGLKNIVQAQTELDRAREARFLQSLEKFDRRIEEVRAAIVDLPI
jgi:hypothetical protein